MKIVVTKKSFYGNKINKVGEIIDYQGNKLPSWAKKLKDKTPEKNEKKNEKVNIAENAEEQNNGIGEQNNGIGEQNNENSEQNDTEQKDNTDNQDSNSENKNDKLNQLLDKAIDKGIAIEFGDKTDEELINELEEVLKENKE